MPAVASGPGKRRSSGDNAKDKEPLSKSLEKFKNFQTGNSIGSGYRLGQQISSGTQGDVFLCAGVMEGAVRQLAAKRVRVSNASICRHLLQEVSAVFTARARYAEEISDPSSPGHPNIVEYVDWFAGPHGIDREVYIAMERCDFALNDMVATANQMRSQCERSYAEAKKAATASGRVAAPLDPTMYRCTEREVVKVMQHVLSGLSFLNRLGFVHRDIKADNILWSAGGRSEGTYKLADFGTAALLREDEPGRKEADCGTLWTMAPEMLGNRPHGLSCDSWSLGVVLFQVASLDYPFNSKELLAYRNSIEAPSEGTFWPAMYTVGGSSSSAAQAKAKAVPAPRPSLTRVPSSPKVTKGKKGRPQKSNSTASLPTVATSQEDTGDSSFASSAGRQLLHGSSVATLPPLAALGANAPSGAAGLQGDHAAGGPDAGQREAAARKRTFLRKRCAFKWCYSEDLQAAIFEDLLEEASAARPSPGRLLASRRVQELAARHLGDQPEVLLTDEGRELAETMGAELMKQITGESFLLAMTASKKQQTEQRSAEAGAGEAVS